MLFAALILGTDRRIVRQLRQAKAFSNGSAIPLHTPPILGGWRLRRLAGAGAICQVRPARYYLEEDGYATYRERKRRRGVLIICILIPSIFVIWAWLNLR